MRIAALDIGGTAIKYGLWDGASITGAGEIPSRVSTAQQLIALIEQAVAVRARKGKPFWAILAQKVGRKHGDPP